LRSKAERELTRALKLRGPSALSNIAGKHDQIGLQRASKICQGVNHWLLLGAKVGIRDL
jgi:hypothetical protein